MNFRRIAIAAASASLLIGGTAALAPSASATTVVGSSACNKTMDFSDTINTNGVNFRTGPSTSYTILRQLNAGAHVYVYCLKVTNWTTDDAWAYIKYNATGQKGWVYAWYLTDYV
jgi:uncharacterized protein YraI